MAQIPNSDNWHSQASSAVLQTLRCDAHGLSDAEAAHRRQQFGANRLRELPRPGLWRRLLLQFHNILIYVLLGAAVVTGLLGHWVDTLVILAVVLVNAIVGVIQEGKAEKALDAIRQILAPRAVVLREGVRSSIDAALLVPGDVVLLEGGDRIPADLRLLQVYGLQVQESILTGESLPVDKSSDAVADDAPLGDRTCMAFSGTQVTAGQASGVVVAIGEATEIGRISGLLARVDALTTPLLTQMSAFARWLTVVILVVAALLLLHGYFVAHHDFKLLFMAVVGLSVSAIPEGLPAVLTITLAVGVQAMARRNAIVRRLPAIETIGAVSVICTDKTGTLTRNEMVVRTLVTRELAVAFEGLGYAPIGAVRINGVCAEQPVQPLLQDMASAALLCNDAHVLVRDGMHLVEGDPMEGALIAMAGKLGIDASALRAQWTRTDAIPFDARQRFMASLHHDHQGRAWALIKGAPERVLAMCATQRVGDDGMTALDLAWWQAQTDLIAARGQRVLALAVRDLPPAHTVLELNDVAQGLSLLGLVGLIDPPRAEAIQAVADCRQAGIRVKMITGDHVRTASAIAAQIGLQHPQEALTGADIDALDDAALRRRVLDCNVYARTSPEHKLRLVMALQAQGLVVAMTGDGVNDAPALKRADAGIAMGRKGSEAAKEAADLVLADDNFASIAAAVREGRTVYDNIRKVISWTLPTSAGEAMTIVVALLLGMTLPITPVQILWINLITATTLGLALAFEPTEAHTMLRPPRRRDEPLLDGELIWHIVFVSGLFLGVVYGLYSHALDSGKSLDVARSIAVNALVVLEIFHLLFIRNMHGTALTWKSVRGTRVVWATVSVVLLAQCALTYVPVLQQIFGTAAVGAGDVALILAAGFALFAVLECEKRIRLALRKPAAARL